MLNLITVFQKYLEKQPILYKNKNIEKNIEHNINNKQITIVTWVLASDRTSIINNIIKNSKYKNNYLYINKELDILNQIKDNKHLNNLLNIYIERFEKPSIIILENINQVKDSKKFIKYIYDKNYKIIFLWNDVKIWEIKEIEVLLPTINKIQLIQNELFTFNEIMTYWTITDIIFIKNNYLKNKYLELLKNNIIYKEIIKTYSLKNHNLYNSTISFLSLYKDYISAREINKKISIFSKISLVTSNEYLDYSLSAKIIKKMPIFNIKKNKTIESRSKYYFTDIWIRNAINWYNTAKIALKENLLYNELYKNWYSILWWNNWKFDFSFYCNKIIKKQLLWWKISIEENNILYIHISTHTDKKEIKKEVKKLLKIDYIPNNNSKDTTTNISKFILVDNIKNLKIKKLQYENLKIIEFEEFVMNLDNI